MDLEATFGTPKPVVGMVHLPPSPGAPTADADADMKTVVGQAVADAQALEAGGVDGLLVENFGDAPYYPDDVPAHTVVAMTRAATAVAEETDLPFGVNVLRNDAEAALAIAAAVGGDFVRVNVHTGALLTDQGLVEGRAHETLRLRERLGVAPQDDDGDEGVAIWADVDVKHSTPLADGSLRRTVVETVERGLADAIVVSGPATGEEVAPSSLEAALEARTDFGLQAPVLIGSGVDADTIADLFAAADGLIVGTALKEDGEPTAPVNESRVVTLVERADEGR